MAKRKITWTEKANLERIEILEYWINRNKSKTYSVKLNQLIKTSLKQVAENPTIGRKTDFDENVRLKIVRDYLIFYQYDSAELKVLSVWSGYRNEKSISIK